MLYCIRHAGLGMLANPASRIGKVQSLMISTRDFTSMLGPFKDGLGPADVTLLSGVCKVAIAPPQRRTRA